MKALCWYGKKNVQVSNVPDPSIINPRDAIIKVTSTAICGSDLHLYDGYIPTMQKGDILGHEFMGEVVEVGSAVNNLNKGDRVVVHSRLPAGLFFLQERIVVGLRQHKSKCLDGRNFVRIYRLGPLRLLAHDGWLRRRAG